MSARVLMILGTASHVGKSILTTALCRILSDEGFRVAPFKAQNMSLNSAATPDGREIGRAQALQAEACRIPSSAFMNPILIKPSSDQTSQVVVLGRVWGQISAQDYHRRRVEELFPLVLDAFRVLEEEYEVIVIEGAGSPAEINLKAQDIANMRMAQAAGAACLLTGDIDRGGVFAALLGTVELLDPAERALLRGFIVNKFRGDRRLLAPGIDAITQRLKLPCAGVIPFLPALDLDEEDSVALEKRPMAARLWATEAAAGRPLRIGVIAFPYIANFTDFQALAEEPSVSLAFIDDPAEVNRADLLILPGSKQTLDDLAWLRRRGLAGAIRRFEGKAGILGICGGMQMLGTAITDPSGSESSGRAGGAPGLALLPIATVLRQEKVTRPVEGRVIAKMWGELLPTPGFKGYEIHLGETVYAEGAQPFAEIRRSGDESALRDGAIAGLRKEGPWPVCGTYVHGLFQDDVFRHGLIAAARATCGLAPARDFARVTTERERRIDRLANHVRSALDMTLVHDCIGRQRACQ